MILVVTMLAAGLSVPLCGGDLGALARLRLRRSWAVAVALVLQVVIISVLPAAFSGWVGSVVELGAYGLALLWLWSNRRVPWLWLVALGGAANLTAIAANGGVMPAARGALRTAGRFRSGSGYHNSGLVPHAHLAFLGDVWAVPAGWPLANVFSAGDVALAVGGTLLLHTVARSRPARWCAARRGEGRRSGVQVPSGPAPVTTG